MNKLVSENFNGNQTIHPTRLNCFIYFKQTEVGFLFQFPLL